MFSTATVLCAITQQIDLSQIELMNTTISEATSLQCPQCGNKARFYEVMEHVENLVDGKRNHLHLLIGDAAFYQCVECGTQIEADE